MAVVLSELGRRQDAKAQLKAVLNENPGAAIAAEAAALLEKPTGS